MDVYVQFLLLGVGTGALYAGLALGLVLGYQGAGVINFAHGTIAMYVAYVYDELRDSGDYVLPLIGLPDRIDLGEPVATAPAIVIALLTAVVLGVIMHAVVFHPLRRQPLLAKVVASVGVMLVLQAVVALRFGTGNRIVAGTLPQGSWRVPVIDVVVPSDRMWLGVVVALVTALLWAVSKWTRFGLATRAAAVEPKGAILLGWSPGMLAGGNWVVAAVVAGIVGILAASMTGLNSVNYVLFVVPALAAALAGRLRSLPVAATAGLALGMVESMVSKLSTWDVYPDWLPFVAAQRALPLLVIIVVLFVQGGALPIRGTLGDGRQPRSPRPTHVGRTTAILTVASLVAVSLFPTTLRFHLFVSLAAAILMLSIVVITGYLGQVSLAQAVFAGAAGFATARLADAHVAFPLSPLLGALAATVVGLLMAVPALRIRGAQLAVVTMAAGVAIEEAVFRNPSVTGVSGAQLVAPPGLFGVDLAANRAPDFNRWEFGVLLVVVVALLAVAVANLRRSGTGRRMLALRSNERAAAAAGVDVVGTKLLAFGLSSFIAGLGGAMLGYLRGAISGDSFSVFVSLTLLAFAYLGGIASVGGALVGAFLAPGGLLFGLLDQVGDGGGAGRYSALIGGVALVAVAILAPEGIAGRIGLARDRARRRRAARVVAAQAPAAGGVG